VAAIDGYAEDYASMIFGLLELFQASGEADWLEWAITLQRRQDELFWDPIEHGWFSTTGTDPSVLLRMKEEWDGAEPSASAMGAWNLVLLTHLTGEPTWHERAREVFAAYGARLTTRGRAMPMMACALEISLAPPEQIVIVGEPEAADTRSLWAAAHRSYRPFATMVQLDGGPRQRRVAQLMPWVASMTPRDGHAAAYLCREFVCAAPTTNADDLIARQDARDD
jgi:uncharacterized protein YyaL (SSP411 family)